VAEPAATPDPPYTAVIFTSVRTARGDDAYAEMAERMEQLARRQPGYLGIESAREELGITVSYWQTAAAARAWKAIAEHRIAQNLGREEWYRTYRVRVATVEREYGMGEAGGPHSERP
jgi:heme-degrading monooxygenase HmoA